MRRLALAAALVALPLPVQAQMSDAEIRAEAAELTARVERLEGVRAIKNLQRAFAYYVDRGLWQQAADLFTDDGSFTMGVDGTYVGRERIAEYLRRLHGGQEGLIYGQLNEWVTLQPAITMADDATSATARWRDLGMLGQYKQHAEWRDGVYENAYVREGGVWKIANLHLYVNFVAPYADGWARLGEGEGLARSQASIDFPPDIAPEDIEAFPEVQIPPFQAPHPVTGREVE
ncbi:nuclear transport factor 2 family protein [Alteraurantiacibacter aquimixticola]|uniref:Nuclear transport factor 2 family protein n=1 Tax=Alteraurantiacibacter aquimixticola TaxID=2489173 RepID=A0A4T3F1F4_9SPHN|nr:nuclear transport factor 2 family protein [Alteraurantiacibacter aquimixticola]TIX50986.1 nuclear transport factor 2 family protein [Alteraurantiacibacter aquimixticola]